MTPKQYKNCIKTYLKVLSEDLNKITILKNKLGFKYN